MDQEEIIKRFVARVVKKFRPDTVLLFGSRARNDSLISSDYDFIIVSDAFAGLGWLDRISAIVHLWTAYENIDVIPYTRAEFADRLVNSSTIRTAMKDSRILYGNWKPKQDLAIQE